MADKTYITFEQVNDDLPADLTKGRAYFVKKKGIIVIDHGNGPVEYGNSANLTEQINQLKEDNETLGEQVVHLQEEKDALLDLLTWRVPEEQAPEQEPEEPEPGEPEPENP